MLKPTLARPFAPIASSSSEHYSPTTSPSEVVLVAGATAGVVSRTATAPLDRCKVLMQVGNAGASTPIQTVRTIYSRDGLCGFFRGNGANVIKVIPEASIRFWAHDRAKRFVAGNPSQPSVSDRLCCGAIAGVSSCLCIYPLELAKTRIAVSSARQYDGIAHCVRRTVESGERLGSNPPAIEPVDHRTRHPSTTLGPLSTAGLDPTFAEGFRGLYKGLPTALVGIIPYSAIDLALYETAKAWVRRRRGREPDVADNLACGGLATCVAQVCTYPLALAKTRLQTSGMQGGYTQYDGLTDCLRCAWRAQGMRGLFRGFMPNLMKAIPSMSITYATFEWTKALLLRRHQQAGSSGT